jgi:hypothetical protein
LASTTSGGSLSKKSVEMVGGVGIVNAFPFV